MIPVIARLQELPTWRLYCGLIILFLSGLLGTFSKRFLFTLLLKSFTFQLWVAEAKRHLDRPIKWLFVILYVYLGLVVLTLDKEYFFIFVLKVFASITLVWCVNGIFVVIRLHVERRKTMRDLRTGKITEFSELLIIREGLAIGKTVINVIILTSLILGDVISYVYSSVLTFIAAFITWIVLGGYTFVKNYWGGLFVIGEHYFDNRPYVIMKGELEGIEGICEQVDLRFSRVISPDKTITYIPNGLLLENPIIMHSLAPKKLIRLTLNLHRKTRTARIRLLLRMLDQLVVQQLLASKTLKETTRAVDFMSRFTANRLLLKAPPVDVHHQHTSGRSSPRRSPLGSPQPLHQRVGRSSPRRSSGRAYGVRYDPHGSSYKQLPYPDEQPENQSVSSMTGATLPNALATPEEELSARWPSFVVLEGAYRVVLQCYLSVVDESVFLRQKTDIVLSVNELIKGLGIKVVTSRQSG